jgi:hypothetical protein
LLGFARLAAKFQRLRRNGHILDAFCLLLHEVEAGLVAVNLYFFSLHFLNIAVPQACERREQGGAFA